MKLSQHKFLLVGIGLAALIGTGLAALNHYVREENNFHEAQAAAVTAMPKASATPSPTMSAPPPQ